MLFQNAIFLSTGRRGASQGRPAHASYGCWKSGNGQHGVLACDQVLRYRILGLLLGQSPPFVSSTLRKMARHSTPCHCNKATTWGSFSHTLPSRHVEALSFHLHAIHHGLLATTISDTRHHQRPGLEPVPVCLLENPFTGS